MKRVSRIVFSDKSTDEDAKFNFSKDFFEIIAIYEEKRQEEIKQYYSDVVQEFAAARRSRLVKSTRGSTESSSSSGRYSIVQPPSEYYTDSINDY